MILFLVNFVKPPQPEVQASVDARQSILQVELPCLVYQPAIFQSPSSESSLGANFKSAERGWKNLNIQGKSRHEAG